MLTQDPAQSAAGAAVRTALDEAEKTGELSTGYAAVVRIAQDDPDAPTKVQNTAALEKLLDQNEDLVAVAKSIMEKLYNPISTSRSFISLSDAQGIVLHALWDNTGSYPIPHLAPGNLAAESASGSVLPEEPTSMSSEPGLACWSKRCVRRLTGRMSDGYARLSAYWRVETKFRLSR